MGYEEIGEDEYYIYALSLKNMRAMKQDYCIGVDFGTDSVRALVVDARNGQELGSAVFEYPRWRDGLFCNPSLNQFRQHPFDYIEGLEKTIKSCIAQIGAKATENVRAISVATTGSTPIAVDERGIPLSMHSAFADDPDAMFILWKDHTAIQEAEEISRHASHFEIDYLQYVGGVYSSEWFWAKLLHILRKNISVKKACYSWVEHSDWIPFLLTGGNDVYSIRRNICAAGHKGLYSANFGGFPPNIFFATLDPILDGFVDRLRGKAETADRPAGRLSSEWAQRLGLSSQVIVGMGALDAHMGAVGGQIKPYYMSKVIGTSTCDMLVAPKEDMQDKLVNGISGQVEGSIIPGMIGLEAGQSAFGDVYSWFKRILLWPIQSKISSKPEVSVLYQELETQLLLELNTEAAKLPIRVDAPFALDWFNGRRTPDVDPMVKGLIGGLSLGTTAPDIFRALVEATCFGSRAIMCRIEQEGIQVKGINAIGGIANKSPFVIQMMADTLNRPIRIAAADQICALGAGMFAAVVCGLYKNVEEAAINMGKGFSETINPRNEYVDIFEKRYKEYIRYGALQRSEKKNIQ